MEYFHMTDVLPLLGIDPPAHGGSSFNIACPCCDDGPNGKHLNINLRRDVYRCPRCGVSGGIFDLYALLTGVPRDSVRRELIQKLKKSGSGKTVPPVIGKVTVKECPMTDVDTRHATYSALLKKLSLAQDHRDNLRSRGLTDLEIDQLGYRTTPVIGFSTLAKQLQSEGFYLSGVPGFYRTEAETWTFIHENRGILIPVRDPNGLIQGLQIRRDNTQRRKFRWISSADKADGCRAEAWTHLAGPIASSIILTEGPMKADVIHALTGQTTLAVPGVNSLTQLKPILTILQDAGVAEIKSAFDMDQTSNPHVQQGLDRLLALLDSMDFKFGSYVWDSRYKGLDDYIWEHCLHKSRSM